MRNESYADQLRRLFPDEASGEMEVGGSFVRDVTIQLTEDCNLACTYCYQHDKTPQKLTLETGKKFIDLLLASDERSAKYVKSRECQGVALNFIGGEPLLEIELMDALTDYFIEQMIALRHPWLHRYRISFATNGMLYFDERVQRYLRKNAAHLSLTVSIDGNKQLHDMCRLDKSGNGTYDRAYAAAKHWEEHYQRNIGTKFTVAPGNVAFLGDALIEFLERGENDINVNCVYEEGWTTEHARTLYEGLKRAADYLLDHDLQDAVRVSILDDLAGIPYPDTHTWCGGNGLMMALDVRGDIYPCIRYTPSSIGGKQPEYKIGDVEHGFVWNEEQEERLRCMRCITRQSQCDEKCRTCPIGAGCGDCAAYSYEMFGTVGRRTTFICEMHIARCLAQTYYKNLAHRKTGNKDALAMNTPKEWAVPVIGEDEYEMLRVLAK